MKRLYVPDYKGGWDGPIHDEEHCLWDSLFSEALAMDPVAFPRCSQPGHAVGSPELVCFSDGSLQAYAGVIYQHWVCRLKDHCWWDFLLLVTGLFGHVVYIAMKGSIFRL